MGENLTEAEQSRLIADHMHLVTVVAADYRGGEVEFDDLCGAGGEGLVKAARSFDGAKSVFSTWAMTKIRSAIMDHIESNRRGWFPKDDASPPLDSNSIEKIYEWDAWGEFGNAMAVSETWSKLDTSPEDLSLLYEDIKLKRDKFTAAFISLTRNERRLVSWVFLDDVPKTIPQAARELGVSRFQAGRMLKKALKTMGIVISRMESNKTVSGGNNAKGHPSIAGLHGCASGSVAA